MSDYSVDVKIRNGRIRAAMRQMNIKNAAELARLAGESPSRIGEILNMKVTPLDSNGEWRVVVKRIATVLCIDPSELFSERQLTMELKTNTGTVEMTEREVLQLAHAKRVPLLGENVNEGFDKIDEAELQRDVKSALKMLTPRLQEIVRLRMFEGLTLEQIGLKFDITPETVRNLESKALTALRAKPLAVKLLRRHIDAS